MILKITVPSVSICKKIKNVKDIKEIIKIIYYIRHERTNMVESCDRILIVVAR